jgi:hypothetical protein
MTNREQGVVWRYLEVVDSVSIVDGSFLAVRNGSSQQRLEPGRGDPGRDGRLMGGN